MTDAARVTSLPVLKIASPCHMRWDDLSPISGAPNRRSCDECGLHVHNFSAMAPGEIAAVLEAAKGSRVCGAGYLRSDGTLIVRDCPVGLRAARLRLVRGVSRAAALLAFAASGAVLWAAGRKDVWSQERLRSLEPFATISAKLDPAPPPSRFMAPGEVCVLPPISTTAPSATPSGR